MGTLWSPPPPPRCYRHNVTSIIFGYRAVPIVLVWCVLWWQYKALGDVVARDTKARHACGIPAPSYNQLKGLHDVRHYSDAEQALILHRLLQPYKCGDVDFTPLKRASSASRPAQNKLPAKNTKSLLSEPNKQPPSDTAAVEKDRSAGGKVDDGSPGSSAVMKPASIRPKRYVLYLFNGWVGWCRW